jgi:hypothetical protein
VESGTGTRPDVARWIAGRIERLSQLTPEDGQVFDLSPVEARRLLAYAGFSLFRAAQALGERPESFAAWETQPAEVAA